MSEFETDCNVCTKFSVGHRATDTRRNYVKLCHALVCFAEGNGRKSCKYFPQAVVCAPVSCPIGRNELSVVVGAK